MPAELLDLEGTITALTDERTTKSGKQNRGFKLSSLPDEWIGAYDHDDFPQLEQARDGNLTVQVRLRRSEKGYITLDALALPGEAPLFDAPATGELPPGDVEEAPLAREAEQPVASPSNPDPISGRTYPPHIYLGDDLDVRLVRAVVALAASQLVIASQKTEEFGEWIARIEVYCKTGKRP